MSCSSAAMPKTHEKITLLVEDSKIVVNPALFAKYPNTMLGTMFGTALENNLTQPNEKGEFKVAEGVSAIIFRAILEYYENGVIYCPPTVSESELHHACDYLLIPFNSNTIRCGHKIHEYLTELSNEAARKTLKHFLQESFFPILDAKIQKGIGKGYGIFLLDDESEGLDTQELDKNENPFIVNKEVLEILRDTDHWDFLEKKLKEKGMKSVKIGHHWFKSYVKTNECEPEASKGRYRKNRNKGSKNYKKVKVLSIVAYWEEPEPEDPDKDGQYTITDLRYSLKVSVKSSSL